MADTPDVLKRLEEIEARGVDRNWDLVQQGDYLWLLRLTRALLESQGELIATHGEPCYRKERGGKCEAVARAEKIRKGEV